MKHQLDFEKPIIELQNKLDELREHPEKHSLDISFEEEIQLIEKKLEETRRQIFSNLTAWQRVQLARHPKRPYTLDYLRTTFTDFQELHGDRLFAEDRAMVGGFAKLGEHRVVVIGTQKGRDTKENILRNFGSAHPEGYRKALRLMRLANKFGLPIITLIDTAGAYPGIGAEERHIAEAIAVNLREMTLLEVPIIAAVIGEGGSGRRAGHRRGRPRVDSGKRLLFRHQPGRLRGDFVEGPRRRRQGRRSPAESPPRICSNSNSWMKSCPNRSAARTTIPPRPAKT